MSLETMFSRYGSPSTEANFSRHYYFTRADKLDTAKRIADADKYAAQDIAELEELIADIKAYRQRSSSVRACIFWTEWDWLWPRTRKITRRSHLRVSRR